MFSGIIVERLKNLLAEIITLCQNGFLPGRQISDNTRLIYDIIHTAEYNNTSGFLVLIDFEKAFDSTSWSFLYHAIIFQII